MGGGGGGGGGFFDSFANAISQTRDAYESVATLGESGKKDSEYSSWKKAGDNFLEQTSGRAAQESAKKEAFNAKRDQRIREEAMTEQDAKSEGQKKFATSRNRQKSLAQGGRSSTILTSPLGAPTDSSGSSGKTLLGS